MNFANIFWNAVQTYGERPVFMVNGESVGGQAMAEDIRAASGMLKQLGVECGDRVGLFAENSAEWFVSLFAIASIGAVCVPINPALTSAEACNIIEHCKPRVVIADHAIRSLLDPAQTDFSVVTIGGGYGGTEWAGSLSAATPSDLVEGMEPSDAAIIFYTSGTTGKPKGVVLGHSAVTFIAEMFSTHSLMTASDISLVMGSVAFIYPLIINALSSLNAGATVIMQERFHPRLVAEAVKDHRVTVIMGVPTMYTMLANWGEGNRHDFSSIRIAYSAGASFPGSLAERVWKELGFNVFDLWGMTECTPVTSFDPARDKAARPDSCGRALPDCAFRIVDEGLNDLPAGEVGEILLTSPARMNGYYLNAEATAETMVGEWVRSGDLGSMDEDGYLYIVGRKKDLIIRGGANIYPVDIEEVLLPMPMLPNAP